MKNFDQKFKRKVEQDILASKREKQINNKLNRILRNIKLEDQEAQEIKSRFNKAFLIEDIEEQKDRFGNILSWVKDKFGEKTAWKFATMLLGLGVVFAGTEQFVPQAETKTIEAKEEDSGFFDLKTNHPDIPEHLENENLSIKELQGLIEEAFEDIYEKKLKVDPKKLSVTDMLKYVIKDEYGIENFDFSKLSPEAQRIINDENIQRELDKILKNMKLTRLLFVRRDLNKLVKDFQVKTEKERSKERSEEEIKKSEEEKAIKQEGLRRKIEQLEEIKDSLSPEHKKKLNNQMDEWLQEQFKSEEKIKKMMGKDWKMTFEKYPATLSGLINVAGIENITEEDIDWDNFQKIIRYKLEHIKDVEQKTKIEKAIAKLLFDLLNEKIKHKGVGSRYFLAERIIQDNFKEASCLGFSQLYDLLGKKTGLDVGIVDVMEDLNGKPKSTHVCNIVKYANNKWSDASLVDINYRRFRAKHKMLRLKINGMTTYAKIKWNQNPELSTIKYKGPQGQLHEQFIKEVQIEPLGPASVIAEGYLGLAVEYGNKEGLHKEQKTLQEAIKLDPTNGVLYYNLARSYQDTANAQEESNLKTAKKLFQNSIKNFKKAIELRPPKYPGATASLGGAYHSLGDLTTDKNKQKDYYNKALENYQKAIKQNPQKWKSVLQPYINKIQK